MNFVIVHFNTPELTTCLLSNVRFMHPTANIFVFDNSNKRPLSVDAIETYHIIYYNNTNEHLLNFYERFAKEHLSIDPLIQKINDLGSAKHALTIDWLIKKLPVNEFVLLDSDVLLLKPIDFCDNTKITIGSDNTAERKEKPVRKARILPYCQYFNTHLVKQHHISYFDSNRILGFDPEHTRGYDTGSSFYEDVLKRSPKLYNIKINLDKYIIHYKGGSWDNTRTKQPYNVFLEENIKLWHPGYFIK